MRDHPVTRESVESAKAAMVREREHVMRQTPGLVIREDGSIVLPRRKAQRPKRWLCIMCERWFMSRMDCPQCGMALERAH